jgi:hypothetical protein
MSRLVVTRTSRSTCSVFALARDSRLVGQAVARPRLAAELHPQVPDITEPPSHRARYEPSTPACRMPTAKGPG